MTDLFEGCDDLGEDELSECEVWVLLHSWYGGGPAVKRRAILQPSGAVLLELYGTIFVMQSLQNASLGSIGTP